MGHDCRRGQHECVCSLAPGLKAVCRRSQTSCKSTVYFKPLSIFMFDSAYRQIVLAHSQLTSLMHAQCCKPQRLVPQAPILAGPQQNVTTTQRAIIAVALLLLLDCFALGGARIDMRCHRWLVSKYRPAEARNCADRPLLISFPLLLH